MKTLLQLLILIVAMSANAQFLPVELSEKIENSQYILEGEIINQYSYKTKSSIYTDYTFRVFSILKGTQNTHEDIIIKAIGGTVGDQKLLVCPSDSYQVGQNYILFLNKITGQQNYKASYLGQSVISLNKRLSEVEVTNYKNNLGLLKSISKNATNHRHSHNPHFQHKTNSSSSISITNISPTSLNAGVGETVTITGSGFGTTGPTSSIKVWTPFANNPSSIISHSAGYNYVSWSDTQIVFKVPSRAGTGQIRVGSSSNFATSSQTLTINTNIRDNANFVNSAIFPVHLPALQNQGIEFVLNSNFTNADAILRTKEALEQWQCETEIDFSLNETTTTSNTNNDSDGLSVLYFDSSMSSSVLGVTLTTLQACSSTGRWYVKDVDLAMNGNTNFNFTLNPTTSSQIDFYSVMLHELGHVRNLGHVLNGSQVMFPSIGSGVDKRTLDTNDILGGNLVQSDSNTNQVCSKPLMVNDPCPTNSISDFDFDTVSIFPNPTIDNISFNSTIDLSNFNYTIFDITGKSIKKGTLKNNNTINLKNISQGVYFIKLSDQENKHKMFKIIKK